VVEMTRGPSIRRVDRLEQARPAQGTITILAYLHRDALGKNETPPGITRRGFTPQGWQGISQAPRDGVKPFLWGRVATVLGHRIATWSLILIRHTQMAECALCGQASFFVLTSLAVVYSQFQLTQGASAGAA